MGTRGRYNMGRLFSSLFYSVTFIIFHSSLGTLVHIISFHVFCQELDGDDLDMNVSVVPRACKALRPCTERPGSEVLEQPWELSGIENSVLTSQFTINIEHLSVPFP